MLSEAAESSKSGSFRGPSCCTRCTCCTALCLEQMQHCCSACFCCYRGVCCVACWKCGGSGSSHQCSCLAKFLAMKQALPQKHHSGYKAFHRSSHFQARKTDMVRLLPCCMPSPAYWLQHAGLDMQRVCHGVISGPLTKPF